MPDRSRHDDELPGGAAGLRGGNTAQQWTLTGSGNTFKITNVTSGRCLARQNKDPGTLLVQGTCVISLAQWQLLF